MSDQEPTAQLPGPEPPSQQSQGPRRLLRSRNDRVIAGVCGGLGNYFAIDPVIVRIAFAISILIGGLGVVVYLALALFVPSGESDGAIDAAPVERSKLLAAGVAVALVLVALSWGVFDGPFWGGGFFFGPGIFLIALVGGAIVIARGLSGSSRPRGAVATVLLALAAFVGLSVAAVLAGWAAATGHGVAIAILVIAIGALLVLAAFYGGARWLVAPALALAIPLGLVSAADISFGDGVGDRQYRPVSVASVQDRYELGIGRLVVDLRDLDWREETVLEVDLDLGVGEAIIAVPPNVCVTTDVNARVGELMVAGDHNEGFDLHSAVNAGATASPRLDLTGEVDVGDLRVINDADAEIRRTGPHFNDDGLSDEAMRNALDDACAPEPAPDRGGGN